MRRGLALAATAAALLGSVAVATGCGGGGGGGGKKVTVGFTTITLGDQFFVRLNNGAKKAAKGDNADVILNNPNGDPAAQATAIENFTEQQVGAIIVDPIDPNGVLPALRAAKRAKIPVVAVDEVLAGVNLIDSSAGDDNRGVGRKLGERLVAEQKRTGQPIRVGIVQTFDSPIENTRVQGFRDAIKADPQITISGRADAKFDVQKAANGAEDLITSDPKINWFYTTGGNYGIGVVSAIKSQRKTGKVRLIGWDLSKQLIQAMRQGTYLMAAEQNADGIGSAAVGAAIKLARGEKVKRFNYVPVDYVTKANVGRFESRYAK